MNTGAPISAMTAPTGSSRGAATRAAQQIGQAQQRPAGQRRGRGDDAVIAGVEPQAHQVRGDQADETDHAAADHGQSRSAPR